MRLHKIFFIIGLLVFILPILGIPSDWKLITLSVLGVIIIILSFKITIIEKTTIQEKREEIKSENETFSEVTPEYKQTSSEIESEEEITKQSKDVEGEKE